MTKFRELDSDQKAMAKEMLMRAIDRRVKEDIEYTNHVYRLLVLGNGAGIVLLASFIGVIAGKGQSVTELVPPLWKFLLGCILAALIYAPHMAVATQAVNHAAAQTLQFLKNEIELESIQGWVLNKRGQRVVALLALLSFALFVVGVLQCIYLLSSLRP
jgi:hypothetical protein